MPTMCGPLWRLACAALCALLVACAPVPLRVTGDAARQQVFETERAFARSMAQRDLAAFSALVSEEAVFFTSTAALRGKPQVVEWWSRFFTDPKAPFSWEPDQVEVLESGTLAFSSGPVRDADGKLISRFNSIWRQEGPGTWRIVFDKGSPLPTPAPPQ